MAIFTSVEPCVVLKMWSNSFEHSLSQDTEINLIHIIAGQIAESFERKKTLSDKAKRHLSHMIESKEISLINEKCKKLGIKLSITALSLLRGMINDNNCEDIENIWINSYITFIAYKTYESKMGIDYKTYRELSIENILTILGNKLVPKQELLKLWKSQKILSHDSENFLDIIDKETIINCFKKSEESEVYKRLMLIKSKLRSKRNEECPKHSITLETPHSIQSDEEGIFYKCDICGDPTLYVYKILNCKKCGKETIHKTFHDYADNKDICECEVCLSKQTL